MRTIFLSSRCNVLVVYTIWTVLSIFVASSTVAPLVSSGIAESIPSIDCDTFLRPIREKRNTCKAATPDHEVDVCLYFSSDYEFLMPFIVHYLGLGVSHIWIYNNDKVATWYNNPALSCFFAEEMISIQPWVGENIMLQAQDHCYSMIPTLRKWQNPKAAVDTNKLWGFVVDVDELIVLHNDSCLNTFVSTRNAPGVAVTWAMFLPELPLTNKTRLGIRNKFHSHSLRGSQQIQPGIARRLGEEGEVTNNNNTSDNSNNNELALIESHATDSARRSLVAAEEDTNANHILILPHETLVRRWCESPYLKTIGRLSCVESWASVHHPNYRASCPFGQNPIDPMGHFIKPAMKTPYTDNSQYAVAQLNHYWALSLAHFINKVHHGKGDATRTPASFHNTNDFFEHSRRYSFVDDDSIIKIYGPYFDAVKKACPRCFDVKLYLTSHLE